MIYWFLLFAILIIYPNHIKTYSVVTAPTKAMEGTNNTFKRKHVNYKKTPKHLKEQLNNK